VAQLLEPGAACKRFVSLLKQIILQ